MQRELKSYLPAAHAGDLFKGTHVLDVVTRVAVVRDIQFGIREAPMCIGHMRSSSVSSSSRFRHLSTNWRSSLE
ncbi:MAG: hypothetical protein QOI94_2117 [Acidobacteriaceae bacterium]|nr:hypothetical protein [Acidobacteriaceae bacterium]